MRKRRWKDLTPGQRAVAIVVGTIQLTLAVSAWLDLAKREPDEVRGDKRVWAVVILVNFVGPILYFRRGRRRAV